MTTTKYSHVEFRSTRTQWLWLIYIRRFRVLLPSFLVPDDESKPPKRLYPSAWLDGIRGIAAFLVVWHHASLLWFTWSLHNGWGSGPDDYLFVQLPFIRLLISGTPHVMVFFVISGYSLSYKPLKLAHQCRFSEVYEAVASSIFRRHPRLFIPAVFTTFCAAMMMYLGWYGVPGGWGGVAIPLRTPPYEATFMGQLFGWARNAIELADFATKRAARGTAYDLALWTLSIEYDCSLVIFLCHAAFARLRARTRLIWTTLIICYCIWFTFWNITLFTGGMFLADLKFYLDHQTATKSEMRSCPIPNVYRQANDGPVANIKDTYNRIRMPGGLWKLMWTFSFIIAIYVLSMPEIGRGGANSPGYMTLAALIPASYAGTPDYFWIPLAALWLIFTVDRAPHLQRIFMCRFPQFLGRISYSLYLVHNPLLYALGWHLGVWCTRITGRETDLQHCLGIAMAASLFWLLTFWAADLLERGVDSQAVKFSRRAYDWLTKEEETSVLPVELAQVRV